MANFVVQGALILALIVGGVVCLAIGKEDWGGRLLIAGLAYAAALFQNRPVLPGGTSPPASGPAAPGSSGSADMV